MINPHIRSAEDWLYSCLRDGLAHSFDIQSAKWVKPYPEVTGYIISYFCKNNFNKKPLETAAKKLIALSIGSEVKGFTTFCKDTYLYPFDTSQILIGFCELYKKTQNRKYYDFALKAGDFLISQQLDNGAIIPLYDYKRKMIVIDRENYKMWNGPYSGLMCKLTEGFSALYEMTKDERYKHRIKLTADFYKKQPDIEYTHPMGYFLEGLLAAGETELVKEKLEKLIIPRIRPNGYIPYTEDLPYAYVSGTIQLGILLFKTGFIEEAKKIREYGRLVQSGHDSGGLFQYADIDGKLDKHVHTEINSWGTKYYCELERLLENA